jgi:hypothetical protein
LEEQKFRAMAQLFSQPNRNFITRRAGERLPIVASVPKVDSYYVKPERVKYRTEKFVKKWQFILPADEARAKLQSRNATLIQSAALPSGEPRTARRKIG